MFDFVKNIFSSSSGPSHSVDMAASQVDLSELPTEQLVKEIERRLECLNKPEKRLILIGEWFLSSVRR